MGIYAILMILIIIVWIGFEIWLVIRDKIQGKGKMDKDRGTRYYNFISIFAGLTAAGFIDGYSRFYFPGGKTISVFWIGYAVMLAGLALRIWAIAVLGKSFRTTVETHKNQQVVKSGPYRLVRHPSYSGLIMMCLGYGIAVQNWLSLIVAAALPLAAILYRINIEEKILAISLGQDYKDYQKHTKKLIPGIW